MKQRSKSKITENKQGKKQENKENINIVSLNNILKLNNDIPKVNSYNQNLLNVNSNNSEKTKKISVGPIIKEKIILDKTTSIIDEEFLNLKISSPKVTKFNQNAQLNPQNLLKNSIKGTFKKPQFRNICDMENTKLIKNYGNKSFLIFKTRELKEVYPKLLEKHSLTSSFRARMVDWMFEIFFIYECAVETYFLAVYILDKYFYNTDKKVCNKDIHLLGVTCIYMASKWEDVYPLQVNRIESISNKKFTL